MKDSAGDNKKLVKVSIKLPPNDETFKAKT